MLDVRKAKVLQIIVESYIRSSEPVGSRYIAEELGGVSSATIRNDMAGLKVLGLIEQLHTSAGSIPTQEGYRLYVNHLMVPRPLSSGGERTIDALFNLRNPDPDKVLSRAAEAVSAISGLSGICTTVIRNNVTVKKVLITSVDEKTLLMTLLVSSGVVRSKVCRVEYPLTTQMVEFFRVFANRRTAGRSLHELSSEYLSSVSVDLGDYSRIFNPVLSSLYELAGEINEGQYFVSGSRKLLRQPELSENAYELLSALENSHLITHSIGRDEYGTVAYIGRETQIPALNRGTIIATTFPIAEGYKGIVAVAGPQNVDYATVMPLLDYFGIRLGKLLFDIYNEYE